MQPTIVLEKIKTDAVVQIGDTKVAVDIVGKKLIMFDKSVNSPVQRPTRANDHQAGSSSSASKYFQLRWCPPGSTRTQKKKLQRLRFQEKKEQEIQKLRDKQFNQYKPMVPQGKVWRIKVADQPARLVKPSQATGFTGTSNRSDRPEQPVRPVDPSIQQKAESAIPVLVPYDRETPLSFSVQGDEEVVDHEVTPKTQQYGAQ